MRVLLRRQLVLVGVVVDRVGRVYLHRLQRFQGDVVFLQVELGA